LAGGDRDHGLVEQAETFTQLAAPHENLALRVRGKRNEIGVGEALADLYRRRSCRGSALEVTGYLALEATGNSMYPCSAHSRPSLSINRCARPNQPVAGPISPRRRRTIPIQNPQRAARSRSPASECH